MRPKAALVISFFAITLANALPAGARKTPSPLAWVHATDAAAPVLARPGDAKAKRGELERGEFAELVQEKRAKGEVWWEVRAANPATLLIFEGWAEASRLSREPYGEYPPDSDLLTKMGEPFLDDFVASHTVIARYLLPNGPQGALLLCYAGSRVLPQARLQVFRRAGSGWDAGPRLDFPFVGMESPVAKIEIRNLLGDHQACLVTTEMEEPEAGRSQTRMVIRRTGGTRLETLWQAPLKLRALDSYPARTNALSPPEKNIGQPGTVTTGKVKFELQNGISIPVWDGKVEFFVLGRERPVQTVRFRKACAWTGSRYEPLN